MKTDRYTKIVLTVIATCLVINLLQNINLIPQAHAAGNNTSPIHTNTPMEVKIVGISTYDELPVNIKEVNGSSLYSNAVPVKIKE